MAKLRIALVENQILDDKDCLIAITKGLQADEWAATIVTAVNERERLRAAVKNALDKVFNNGKRPGWVEIQQSAIDELYAALKPELINVHNTKGETR